MKILSSIQRRISNETVHDYWCAGTFSYPLQREALEDFLNKSSNSQVYFAIDDKDEIFGFFILQSSENPISRFCSEVYCIYGDSGLVDELVDLESKSLCSPYRMIEYLKSCI
ncbi:MAG: hypothetical protein LIO71_01045 [Ruminococcus sp.]|nr:hypothetical protein [Ruminococcus sp.]